MARSVYKICSCRNQVKCRHPWWFSFKRAGEPRLRKSLDFVLEKHIDSKTVAAEEAERLRIGMIDDTLPPRTRELLGLPPSLKPLLPTLTIEQLLNVYTARNTGRAPSTLHREQCQVGMVSRSVLPRPTGGEGRLGDWLVSDVTADTLEQLREARLVRSVQTRDKRVNVLGGKVAANRSLRLLRAAFNWGLRTGTVKTSPFRREGISAVRLTKEASRSRRLQGDEGDRLLAACGPHLRFVVEAALETGCRRGELLSMEWQQLELGSRPEVWLPEGKTKTAVARRVPISTRLKALLEMRRTALRTALDLQDDEPLPDDVYVFGNEIGQRQDGIKTAWGSACARARIDGLRFHDLRREAGSRWMDAGVPLATIQKWLGHANISQTSTYLATTTAGEHDAMRRYEERMGRLTPIDTKGATPPHNRASSAKRPHKKPKENTISH